MKQTMVIILIGITSLLITMTPVITTEGEFQTNKINSNFPFRGVVTVDTTQHRVGTHVCARLWVDKTISSVKYKAKYSVLSYLIGDALYYDYVIYERPSMVSLN